MPEINICNSVGRDAVVQTEHVKASKKVRWVDAQARQVSNARILKASIDRDIEALLEKHGDMEKVGEALIEGDPEVDTESTGSFLREVSRVYIDQDRNLVHKISRYEIIRNPDGSERDRRPRKLPPPNVNSEVPLRWSNILIKKREAYRRFVFVNKQQLVHINGLTYDFLYAMAKELEEKDSLMLVGGGPKSNQPLILRRGSSPYRGFLEGRTDGEKYCLILHLSNMELKTPEPIEEPEPEKEEPAKEEPAKVEPAKKDAAKKDAVQEELVKQENSAESKPAPAKKKAAKKKAAGKKAAKQQDAESSEELAAAEPPARKKAAKKKTSKKATKKKAVKKKAAKKKTSAKKKSS